MVGGMCKGKVDIPHLTRNLQLYAQPFRKSNQIAIKKKNAPHVGWRERFLILLVTEI